MPSIQENFLDLHLLKQPKRNPNLDGYYYHISDKECLGNKVKFFPRVPFESGDFEPEIPRICFSPSVSQCFFAISHKVFDSDNIYVYKSKVKVYNAVGVSDQKVTGEVWSLEPAFLNKKIIISKNKFELEDYVIFQKLMSESYGCWFDQFKFNIEKGFEVLQKIRDFMEKHNIKDYP